MTAEQPGAIGLPAGDDVFPVLPLRDIVVFPHMIVPLFVGREKSIRALEEVMRADKQILLATQQNPSEDEPTPETIFNVGTLASVLQLLKLPDGTVKVLVEGVSRAEILRYTGKETYYEAHARKMPEPGRRPGRGRGAGALGRRRVRELREAQQEDLARGRRRGHPDRRLFQARRHRRLAPRHQDPREAGDPGAADRRRAAGARARPDGERDLGPAGREAHPLARQAPDGEDAARVLPQRADEGDPEGAWRLRGRPRRAGRARGEDRQDQVLQGSPREGPERAEEAPPDEPDVGRGDGGAQLSRLAARHPVGQEVQGQVRPELRPGGARRGPLRPREGQGPHRRVSRRAEPCQQAEGPDPLPRRPARRRQDLARQVDRPGDRPRVRAHVARRRARRGRDPRPPADLYRLDARQGHPVDAQGEEGQPALPARRDRQDRHGFPRRSVVGAAGGARPRAELDLQRPLPRGRLRPLQRDVRHHGEHAQHPAAA